jgi:hypothetical protein
MNTLNNDPLINLEQPSNIIARPIDKFTTLSLIGTGDAQKGPWPIVTNGSNRDEPIAPPPEYLSVAAWAA